MKDLTKDELNTVTTIYNNYLKDKYGIKDNGTVYKNSYFEFEEIEVEKSRGFFKKTKYKTGEKKYKITRVYFFAVDTPKGLVSYWNDYFTLRFTNIRDMFDYLIEQTEDFNKFADNLKNINLELTVKS